MISYHNGKHASNDLGTELERRKERLLERWAFPYFVYDNSFRSIYTSQNLDFKHMVFTVYQVYVNQDQKVGSQTSARCDTKAAIPELRLRQDSGWKASLGYIMLSYLKRSKSTTSNTEPCRLQMLCNPRGTAASLSLDN